MNFDAFKALREQIRNGGFTRMQLADLLGETVARICNWDEPEVASVRQSLSDACEALDAANEAIDAREALFDGPDEMTLAKDRAIEDRA